VRDNENESATHPYRRWSASASRAEFLLAAIVCGTACGTPSGAPHTAIPQNAAPARPPAKRIGNTADHLVVLRAPHDSDRALAAVFAFFDAVQRESREDLLEALTPDAVFRTQSGHDPSLLARIAWNQRFARLDYDALQASSVFRPSDLRTFSADDLEEISGSASPGPDDLWVVVPIRTRSVGGVRLFGRTITLLLHPTDRGYKIAAQVEDFQLP
jgi:hypothetical protein